MSIMSVHEMTSKCINIDFRFNVPCTLFRQKGAQILCFRGNFYCSVNPILEEISNYYNPVFTPPETPIDPIVQQIPTAIEIDEYRDFLTQLKSFTLERYSQPFEVLDGEIAKIWYRQFELPEVYCEILIEFLTVESEFCLDVLRRKSSIIRHFHGKETFIRELWRSKLKVSDDYKVFIS